MWTLVYTAETQEYTLTELTWAGDKWYQQATTTWASLDGALWHIQKKDNERKVQQ